MVVQLCIGLFTAWSCSKKRTSSVNAKDIYMFSAVTSASYLSETTSSSITKNLLAGESDLSRPELVKDDIENINSYLNMFEGYLLNGNINQSTSKTTEADGDYANYNIKLTATLPNGNGTNTEFKMYYNEINSETNIGIEDDEEETEVNTKLNGVMIVNKNIFYVTGEKVVEIEENETEIEITFTTKSKDNPNNYIVVKQEMELGEIEYEYKIYEDGNLVSSTKIEWEKDEDDDEEELTLQFKNLSNGTLNNLKYSLEKIEENDILKFEIKCKYNGITEKFYVVDNGDFYTYTYSNGYVETINK